MIRSAGGISFLGPRWKGPRTAPGMHPAGYNPTGSPTLLSLPLQFNGGGGEPRFLTTSPIGTKVRFATDTPGAPLLRGLERIVVRVIDDRTVGWDEPLPCTPVASDVCYLEI